MKKIITLVFLLALPSLVSAATLSISPSSQSLRVGDTFTVTLNLDTQGKSVDGVDLRYLNYNNNVIQVQDADSNRSGIQITPGNLMPMTLANSVDQNLGRIVFSQVVAGGNKYSGSGVLATITFRAIASGNTDLIINHSPQNTTDSNVASLGTDILSNVVNASYSVIQPTSSGSGGGNSGIGGGGGGSSGGTPSQGTTVYNPISVTGGSQIVRNLFKGAEGEDVRVLQNFLVSKGYMTSDNITGFYGPVTENAVKRFQSDQGIVSSGTALSTGYGFVGPTTKARINQLMGTSVVVNTQLDQAKINAIKAQIVVLQQQVLQLLIKLQTLQLSGR